MFTVYIDGTAVQTFRRLDNAREAFDCYRAFYPTAGVFILPH